MSRMRWIVSCGAVLVASHLSEARWAVAVEPLLPPCNCRPKSCLPAAYCVAPGCCEQRRHCFDNAWDGYCQERACWDALVNKIGTGAFLPSPTITMCNRRSVLENCLRPADACGCRNAVMPTPK